MHSKSLVALACSGAIALTSPLVSAEDAVNISGFLTSGVSVSDNEIPYLTNKDITDELSFSSDTVLGIQLDSSLDEKTRVSAQLISNFSNDNFDTNAEWLFVERNVTTDLRVRAGRLRLPVYAASRYVYVGSAYPWVRPPEEVYAQMAGITRFTGLDAIWQTPLAGGTLSLQPYAGSIKGEDIAIGSANVELNSESLFGVTTKYAWGDFTAQAMFIKIDATIDNFPKVIDNELKYLQVDLNAEIATLALQAELGNFDLRTEWANRDNDVLGNSWGWYGTVAYHHNQFTPYMTLGLRDSRELTFDDLTNTRDSESAAFGLRWDMTPKVALKSELHYGKAKSSSKGLFSEYIEDPDQPGQLEDDDVLLASFTVNVLF